MLSRETSGFKRVSSLVMSSKRIRYLDQLPKSSQWTCWIDVCVSHGVMSHMYIYIRLCLMNENDVYIMYKSMFIYIYTYIYILWFGCVLCMHLPLQQRIELRGSKAVALLLWDLPPNLFPQLYVHLLPDLRGRITNFHWLLPKRSMEYSLKKSSF